MDAFKMTKNELFKQACKIIDSIEQIQATSLSLTNKYICAELEEQLGYSLSHMRDIFKLSTNMSLTKYIKRRKYTNILSKITAKDFKAFTMSKQVFGIQNFKSKCLHEFPLLNTSYSSQNMQPPIDKSLIQNLLDTQLEQKNEHYLMNSDYKEIVKNRIPYEIKSISENIIIQTSHEILIDLEKTYFKFEDIVFKIFSRNTTNTSTIIKTIYQFLEGNTTTTNNFPIALEYHNKYGRTGVINLISSTQFTNSKLLTIKFVDDSPFLLFKHQEIVLNLAFLTDIYKR